MREGDRHVQSVADALRLIEVFRGDETLRLEELHRRSELPRSRILRYAGTLEAGGYIERRDTGEFALGLKLYALGSLLAQRVKGLTALVRPALRRLSERSGNTAFYSVLQGYDRIVVAKEEGGEGLRFVVSEGSRRPLHSGATGKLLLAHADPELQDRIRENPNLSHNSAAVDVDTKVLAEELDRIRRDGFCISRGEATPYGFAVAVPLPVMRGGVVQHDALTIAGPLGMLTDDLANEYVEFLRCEVATLLMTSPSKAALDFPA
jgi:DNA-binding IclR family transcriptional regulator